MTDREFIKHLREWLGNRDPNGRPLLAPVRWKNAYGEVDREKTLAEECYKDLPDKEKLL